MCTPADRSPVLPPMGVAVMQASLCLDDCWAQTPHASEGQQQVPRVSVHAAPPHVTTGSAGSSPIASRAPMAIHGQTVPKRERAPSLYMAPSLGGGGVLNGGDVAN